MPCVGFHHRSRHRAPLGGLFERRINLGRRGRRVARSTEPSNSKMEPTRLTVRAIMALRRAAHFER